MLGISLIVTPYRFPFLVTKQLRYIHSSRFYLDQNLYLRLVTYNMALKKQLPVQNFWPTLLMHADFHANSSWQSQSSKAKQSKVLLFFQHLNVLRTRTVTSIHFPIKLYLIWVVQPTVTLYLPDLRRRVFIMSASATQGGRKRVVHQLDTPFSTVSW